MKKAAGRLSDFLNAASMLSHGLSILAAGVSLTICVMILCYPEFLGDVFDYFLENIPRDTDANPAAIVLIPLLLYYFPAFFAIVFLVAGVLLQQLRQEPVFGKLLKINVLCVLAVLLALLLA